MTTRLGATSAAARYWDEVAAWRREAPPPRLWRIHSDLVNLGLLARWLPPAAAGALVLKTDLFDEALSDGLYPRLAADDRSFVGIDLSLGMVHAARARHAALRAVAADVRWLPFADETFDAIVSNSTLDHFDSLAGLVRSLGEFRRVLRPEGRLVLTLDNAGNPAVRLRNALPFRFLHRLRLVPYYVGPTCGVQQLRDLLRATGFEVLETDAVMHCPRVVAVAAAGLVERRGGSSESRNRFLRRLMAFERLGRWPTRYRTGHFVAALARPIP